MNRTLVVALTLGSALALAVVHLGIGRAVDDLLVVGSPGMRAMGVALVASLAAGACAWASARLSGGGLAAEERNLRGSVLAQVFALGATERSRERTGRIVSTATDGVERAATYRATFLAPMVASLLTPVVVLVVVAVALDPLSAGLLALGIPLVPLGVGGFQKAFRSVSSRYRASSRALAAQELDAIQGLSTLALLNAGDAMGRKLARAAEDVRRRVMRLLAGNQLVLLVVDSVFSLAMVTGAVVLALWRLGAGALTPGGALALVLMSSLLLEPLDRIGQFFYVGMGGIAAGREIRAFRAQEPAVADAPGVEWPAEGAAGGSAEGRAPGGIDVRLEDVHFSYPGAETLPVLRGADLRIAAGEHVVLTGTSGAGKTTIASLVHADLRPTSGRVVLAGHDLADVPLEWTRSRIGVVAQETHLFTGTLRDNLLVADPEADDTRLLEALDRAQLTETVHRLPDGLDTAVGERGLALSGGEAQRVAIARVLLKDAPVLILDEPTAHIDLTSEREVLLALDQATRGRTTLTISHRRATLDHADRCVRLVEGRVVDTSTGTDTDTGADKDTATATTTGRGVGSTTPVTRDEEPGA